jgi:hypothetical protein
MFFLFSSSFHLLTNRLDTAGFYDLLASYHMYFCFAIYFLYYVHLIRFQHLFFFYVSVFVSSSYIVIGHSLIYIFDSSPPSFSLLTYFMAQQPLKSFDRSIMKVSLSN